MAQEQHAGAYLGFGLGQLDYEEDAFGVTFEDTALAYKLYGGYRFNETWALEGLYGNTSDLKWSAAGPLPGLGNVTATLSGDYEILEVRGLAHIRAFFAGIGLWDAEVDATLSGSSTIFGAFSESASSSDSGLSLILGGQWDFELWRVRAEYELFDTESSVDAYTLDLGVHYRF